jgi:formylmethanofuran dehydrogenase subunit E-like metal-binding protein
MSSIAGYNVKEEASEIKKNLFENRDSFLMLIVAGVTGGLITRALSSESLKKESILSSILNRLGIGESYDEDEDE